MKKLLFSLVLLTLSTFSFAQLLDSSVVFFENFDGDNVSVILQSNYSQNAWRPQTSHPSVNLRNIAQSQPNSYYIGKEASITATGKARMSTPAIPVDDDYKHIYLDFDHICKAELLAYDNMKIAVEFSDDGVLFFDENEYLIFKSGMTGWPGRASYARETDGTDRTYSTIYKEDGQGNEAINIGYSQSSYSNWTSSPTPSNTWWKHELLDIGRAIHNSPNKKSYFRLVFSARQGAGSPLAFHGWFVDNIKVTVSNADIFPPKLSFLSPLYNITSSITNIGPYTVNARIVALRDTVDINSINFTYSVNSGPILNLPTNIVTNVLNSTSHTVNVNWVIPQMCYGDTIRYWIEYADTHGNSASSSNTFIPRSTLSQVTDNDAGLLSFYNFPWSLSTSQDQDVNVVLHNRSPNDQISAVIGWKVNNTLKSDYLWEGDLCMDFTDTANIGNFRPIRGWNNVVAYIKSRNGNADNGIIANDTIKYRGYACDSVMRGTYTMGDATSDFPTLQDLKLNFWYCGLSGPVTINIKPGTYENFVFDTMYLGMSEANYIQFQSATGNADDVIIVDNAASNNATTAALTLTKVSHYRFHNLTFNGKTGGTSSRGIFFYGSGGGHHGSQDIHITHCKINIEDNYTATGNTHVGIGRTVQTNTAPADLVYLRNNTINGGTYGIYFAGASSAISRGTVHIENNEIRSSYRGIYLQYFHSPQIDKNRIFSNPSSTLQFTGIHIEQVGSMLSISQNQISSNNALYGLYLANATAQTGENILISNNVINVGFSTSNCSGIELSVSSNLDIINNTIYTTSSNILEKTTALNTRTGTINNLTLHNNIFSNQCRSTTNSNYAISLNSLPATYSANYNCYYSDGYNLGFLAAARATLDDWRHATNYQDLNSISRFPDLDPNPTNLLNLNQYDGFECERHTDVQTDITGLQRNTLTYMGAYTIVVPSVNLAVSRLVSPSDILCANTAYDFEIALLNAGGEPINFSTNNARIIATYSGGINRVDTFYHSTGAINPLQEVTVSVGSHALAPNTTVDLLVVVSIAGDIINTNDTLRASFKFNLISLNNALGENEFEENFSTNLTDPLWKIKQISGAGNWVVEQGTGSLPPIAPVYGTGRLHFNAKNLAANPQPVSRIYLPTLSLVGSVNPILEIWYAHDNGGSSNSRTREGIILYLGTGENEPSIALRARELTAAGDTLLKRFKSTAASTGEWTKYTFELSNWIGQGCVRLAINAVGAAGSNINIDRILIRNVLDNDCAINDFYYYSEAPTAQELSTTVKARISNIGAQNQNAVSATLTISGANTYTETISNISINSQQETMVYFNGTDLTNVGNNTITVTLNSDQDLTNNSLSKILTSYPNKVSYSDTNSNILPIGSNTAGYKLVNRVNVDEEIMVKSVHFYPVSALDAVGKRVLAFSADLAGNIRVYSDTLTITEEMVNTWVEMPLHNYALSNVSDCFYAGIELIDPGFYIGAQLESPLRDSIFYIKNNNNTYSAQLSGKAMIGFSIDQSVTQELAILELTSPRTNCDLGHENISIRITNNGSQTIPAGTVFHCTINGVNHYVDTLNETLSRLETKIFSFRDHPNMTNNVVGYDSTFAFTVWAELNPGDRINFNDTLRKDIISLGKSNQPTVTSPVNVSYHHTANLTATYPTSIPQADGELSWFANTGFESWEMLHLGDIFTTPTIFFDTAFYVNVAPGYVSETTVGTISSSANMHPFMFSSNYAKGRILYQASELGSDRGNITKIALNVHAAAPANEDGIPIKMYIKNTSTTGLTSNITLNWADELEGAMLFYDGNLVAPTTGWLEFQFPEIFEYTGENIMILTETNCGGSCGSNPTFKIEIKPNSVQSSVSNTSFESGRFTNSANRFVMKFFFSHLNCASEKVPIQIIVPDIPNYDVETVDFLYPYPNPSSNLTNCALEWENVQVSIRNKLNTSIPANKVIVHATFNGSPISHTIDEEFLPFETKVVTFAQPFDFKAPTAHITWNYVVSTDLVGETNIYRLNDTIRGSFQSNRTDYFPDVIDTTGEYSHPFTIRLSPTHNYCFFYTSEDATSPITSPNGNRVAQITVGPLYDTVTYWVEALNVLTTAPRCTTKRVRYNVNVTVPDHDLKMISLNSPTNFACGLMNENLDVTVANTKDSIIPSGTFKVTANFTGTSTRSVEHTINTNIAGQATVNIPFSSAVTLGSTTINNIYNYKIFVDPIDPTMTIYYGNDTISGGLKVPASPVAPAAMPSVSVSYGDPALVAPATNPLNYFYFYDAATGGNIVGEGTSFTTPEVYSPQTYYYSGRITHPEFANSVSLGNSSTSVTVPFNFSHALSQGVILYKSAELGGYSGRIDTIALNVLRAGYGEIPVKIYLKNDSRTTLSTSLDFNALKAASTLIFDSSTEFASPDGWFRICIPGGFDYTGESLLLLTEHDCGGAPCESIGVSPTPTFKGSNASQQILSRTSTTQNFTSSSSRINTRFYINYTCESPRSQITVTPTPIPACDLMITRIENPITPKNPYTANETVKIHFKNYGTSAASGFSVGYTYNGNTVIENYSGSIPSGGVGSHTFNASIDLSEIYFAQEFKAFVAQTCDNFSRNDTLTIYLRRPDPCISRATDFTGADISNFTFAGVSTGLGAPIFNYTLGAGENGSYTDYTLDPTVAVREVVQGQFYPFSITNSFLGATGTTLSKYIYIDLNGDNSFSPTERVFFTPTAVAAPTPTNSASATTTGIITIPENATPGLVRLRVITAYGSNATSSSHPCIPYAYGETEDYAIRILVPYDNDLGIAKIFHPSGSICADATGRIRIIVKNYGLTAQYFSASDPLDITATVSGAVPGTYTKSITNGSLAAGDEMTVIIDNVDFSAVGNYTVTVNMTFANDMYLVNNQATNQATVQNTNIWNLTTEEFPDETFGSNWTTDNTLSSYKWNIFQGKTGNYNNAGPEHDHTVGDPMFDLPEGRFAAVSAASNVSSAAIATLTSACVNLHYEFGYPQRLTYWHHIFGAAAAKTNFYVQIGSGDNYITVDSLFDRTHTSSAAAWSKRIIDLLDVNENARIRFYVTGHNLLIDPAIDDISISNGFPDIGIEEIVFPRPYTENECLRHSDSINMVVLVKNYGTIPVSTFNINGRLEIGSDIQSITESVSGTLLPGESREYTFIGKLHTSRVYDHNAFIVETILSHDNNSDNNKKTTISCLKDSTSDVGNYDLNGVILGQNIPNPANMKTVIPFFIPQGGNVKFTIHTIEGQLLYSNESGYDMGEHQIEINTANYANGLYFYTLYYNDVVLSKKMVIQKQ